MHISPYPFDRLPKLTRTALHAHAQMQTLLDGFTYDALAETSASLLGDPTRARWSSHAIERLSHEQLGQRMAVPLCAVLLQRATGGRAQSIAVECTPSVAALLVDRTLGGRGENALAQGQQALDDLSRGVLAYLVARLLAEAPSRFTLRDVLSDTESLLAAISSGSHASAATWLASVELEIGTQRASLRVLVPDELLMGLAPSTPPRASAWPREVPLWLCAEAGRAVLDSTTLASLEYGDIVVLDDSGLVYEAGAWLGSVHLRIAGASRLFLGQARGTQIEIERACAGESSVMTTGKIINSDTQPTAAGTVRATSADTRLAADAPIELSAELARFSLSFGELTELGPGSVLVTGRRIGEAITLRAAGRAVAEGELVDVEGEVGVRVLRLLRDDAR